METARESCLEDFGKGILWNTGHIVIVKIAGGVEAAGKFALPVGVSWEKVARKEKNMKIYLVMMNRNNKVETLIKITKSLGMAQLTVLSTLQQAGYSDWCNDIVKDFSDKTLTDDVTIYLSDELYLQLSAHHVDEPKMRVDGSESHQSTNKREEEPQGDLVRKRKCLRCFQEWEFVSGKRTECPRCGSTSMYSSKVADR